MSSLKDLASLIMVPSLYKDGELHTVKPLGNSILHPDATGNHDGTDGSTPPEGNFTFSRGSNLAATRVDVNGLIEKGRENLLLQSNNFSNASWIKTSVSVTSGQSGYDGTNDAWLLSATASNGNLVQNVSHSGVNTLSFYAKQGSLQYVYILFNGSGFNGTAAIDLADGAIYNTSAFIVDIKTTDVGGGWYRIEAVSNRTNSDIRIYPSNNNSGGTTAAGNIYIQDAQLEAGLVATDYIETGASTAQAGILEDMPRLDYSGGASCPALLLEPQRTNVVANSEYHSGSTYGNNSVTTTDNEAISPEGVQNAAKIVLDSGTNISNGGHYLSFSSTGGTTYTISVFAKAGEYRYFTFTYGSSAAGGGHFDLQEGTLLGTITNAAYSNITASIEDYGNGWYRLVVSLRDNASVGARFMSMKPSPSASVPSNNNYSSTGDGVSGAYIYGFQLEQGSYATSYIPTYGSSVTRSGDTFEVTGVSDLIDSQGGVMLLETQALDRNQGYSGISLSDDTFTNNAQIRYGSATDQIQIQYRVGSSNECLASNSENDITNNLKIAFKYEADSFKMFVNGVLEATDTSGSVNATNTFDTIKSNRGDGNDKYLGKIKQLVVFPTALTDSECIALTTL